MQGIEDESCDTGLISELSDVADSEIRQKKNMYNAFAAQKLRLIVQLEKAESDAKRQKSRADSAAAEVKEYKEKFKNLRELYGDRLGNNKAWFFCH